MVQVYGCTKKLASGKLFITQNYVGFRSAIPKVVEHFPFRKIGKIEKVKMAAIRIVMENGEEYEYGAFTQRDEAIAILLHLLDNPPSYMMVETTVDVAPKSPRITVDDGSMSTFILDEGEAEAEQQQQEMSRGKVDTASARRGVQKMYQARDMGLATLDELDRQREVVHGIDQRLENINADLSHNDRHLRGIESIAGALANKATKDKTQRNALIYEVRERKIEMVKKRDTEVDVLYKFSNDKLAPSKLVFKEKVFVCADAANPTKLVDKGAQWEYEEVKLVLLRARHQHMDVWFKTGGKDKRIRLMTAHVQWITNEFSLRCGSDLDVQWEPGAKKFDYGSVDLASLSVPKGRKAASDNGGWGATGGKSKTSGLISKGASQQTRDDLDEQDGYLDEMSRGLDQLQGLATAIGTEVDSSTQKIRATNQRMDETTSRVQQQNRRVEKVLNK